MPITTAEFRKALGHFPTGVTVLTVMREEGRVHGMTANSFTSVSLEPLQILVCVDHRALTHEFLNEQRDFGVNILAEDQEAMARFFAQPEQTSEDADQLGVAFLSSARGTPLLDGSLVQLDCKLVTTVESGDHSIFIGEVLDMKTHKGRPLIFHLGQFKKFGVAG
jgi:flavin reductase (DIM6/NTAB) family NADH-FMN oxidoreductase RutF